MPQSQAIQDCTHLTLGADRGLQHVNECCTPRLACLCSSYTWALLCTDASLTMASLACSLAEHAKCSCPVLKPAAPHAVPTCYCPWCRPLCRTETKAKNNSWKSMGAGTTSIPANTLLQGLRSVIPQVCASYSTDWQRQHASRQNLTIQRAM